MKKLFFFGDSISFGHMVSIHRTWCSLISQKFEDKYICNNPSKNGNTTKDALGRIAHDIERHNPDVVFIQFGLNDANFCETDRGIPRISENLYETNLKEIILRIKNICDVEKIIIATNHLPTKEIDFLGVEAYRNNVMKYNQIVRDISNKHDVDLIDHEIRWSTLDESVLLLDDGVHLNTAGHKLYYKTILEAAVL